MEIRLLGRFEVIANGAALSLGGHRQRAVLAVLALHANEVVSVDRLVEEVWGGELPDTAVATMQRYVSHLRRALDGQAASIDTRRPGYALTIDTERIDARRFERMVEDGRRHLLSGSVQEAAMVLRAGLSLWHGEPLADFAYESFARIEATRLEELRLTATEMRVDADLALGRHAEVVADLEALVASHPLRESFRGQLMRALHRAGRRADALRVYSQGRHVLADELGLDPSTDLQRLEHAILVEDATVEAPVRRDATGEGRLPQEVTSFVGRAQEVHEVAELVARSRLVTLTGVGGSGKSRLALRVATAVAPSLSGGAWLVELGATADAASAARVVAHALGVRDEPERDAVDLLIETMRHEHCLVVLDGCERIVEAIAPLAERLLAHTTGVRILATSRETLDIHAEAAFRVPTLAVPADDVPADTLDAIAEYDSVQLFVERARSADASFHPTDADAPTISELCRRLEGLPLALELAAAQTDVLTLRQVADRLDDRFELLTGGRRTAPPRQRTLRATIEWSYDLLGESERLLFDRLAVFAGTFTLSTAEAVCAGGGLERAEVFPLLAHLVRKSLVVRVHSAGPVAHYRLLDALRDYGRERLQERPDGVRAHERHVQFFTEMLERAAPALRSPGAVRVFDELEVAHAEFRAALTWLLDQEDVETGSRLAAALVPFWDYRCYIRDGQMWLGRIIDMARRIGAPPSHHRLLATIGAAYCDYQVDEFSTSAAYCNEAELMLESVPDDIAEAKMLTVRSEIARAHNDLGLAKQFATRAIELCHRASDHANEANAYRVLTLVNWDRGEVDETMAGALECLRASQTCGDLERIAGAQSLLATLLKDRGLLNDAAELFEECLGRFQQLAEPWGIGVMLWHLSGIAAMQGAYDAATGFAEQSLRVFEEVGIPRGIGEAHLLLADAELGRGNLEQAEQWCASALERFRMRGYGGDLVLGLATAARIRLARDDLGDAVRCCDEALVYARARDSEREVGRLLNLRAALCVRQGSLDEAAALVEEATALFDVAADGRGKATALTVLADIALAEGRHRDAQAHLTTALAALAAADAAFTKDEAAEFERIRQAADAVSI